MEGTGTNLVMFCVICYVHIPGLFYLHRNKEVTKSAGTDETEFGFSNVKDISVFCVCLTFPQYFLVVIKCHQVSSIN